MLKRTLNRIRPIDESWVQSVKSRTDQLIKPIGSLGKLETYYVQMGAIQQTLSPSAARRAVVVFSGDHGVIEEDVATCPQRVTLQQTENFVRGYTGMCAIAKQAGAKVYPVDVAINGEVAIEGVINRKLAYGSANIKKGPAMSRQQAIKALEVGIEIVSEVVKDGVDILATGEMGICNTTPSAAILSVLTGLDPAAVTGVGANLDDERLRNKIEVVRTAVSVNNPDKDDPIDILCKVGGYEIAAMTGAFLAAAANRVAIVVDGFIATVAALLAVKMAPASKDYLIPSHKSHEKGAAIASQLLGLEPPLDMQMRLGEGSGAVLMFNIVDAACSMGKNMITFDEADIGAV